MAILTVAGTTIRVASAEESAPHEVGESVRTFDGTSRSSVRARKRVWRVTTTPLTDAEHTSIRNTLQAAPPLSCTGALFDGAAVDCVAEIQSSSYIAAGQTLRRVIQFELRER